MTKRFASALCVSLFLLFPQVFHAQVFHGCSPEGDATDKTRSDPALNRLKNRAALPSGGFEKMNFEDLADAEVPVGVSKKHIDNWPQEARDKVATEEEKAAQVTGYLLKIKLEGPESCNCHSEDQADRDFHIWLANSADDDRSDAVVVEISPRIRANHAHWTRADLNKLVTGRTRVRISGWLMLDPEHPEQLEKTRHTLWEIHPIMKIEFLSAGKWREL